MAQTIKLKRSSVSGNTPSTSDLELGEVAINTYDGKMFIKKNDGSDSIVEIGGTSGTVTEAFKTIAVSGQSSVVADSATDTLTLVAGSNMTLTTNASGDTITFASSGGGGTQNVFSTFAVSGQSNVVADSTTDTLTFAAGSGINITTNAGTDTITIAATASAITVQDEGSSLSTAATTLNFVGAGVTASGTGATKTITIGGGGGSQNLFSNIGVSGQGTIQADSTTDTLTFEAGTGISLATDTTNDKLTITATGGTASVANAASSIKEFKYDITTSTTTITGSDANSNTLAYEAGAIQVFLNGILLDPATDYTASNGTSVVLTDAAVSGDDVQILAFNRKIVTANVGLSTFTGDGTTTAFTLSSDPVHENNTRVHIDGVYQEKAAYSVSGTTLTFSAAPPNLSSIEVEIGFTQAEIGSTLDFADNAILRIGTGNDLQILHDGSNSIIKDTGTGDLQIAASTLEVKNSGLSETMLKAIEDGAVELYFDNSKKLETVTGGVTITGTVTATTFSGDLSGTINTATTGTTQSASDNSTKIATTAYVDTAVTNLVDSAPGTLNTLNELAAALGDDANFSTTITNSLNLKVGRDSATGAATIPAGTTAQRPGSPAAGQFRYNSTLNQFEGYTSSWGAIGGGGTNTFTTDVFTSSGSATFTLTQAVASPNDCIVHIDGIYQTPTDAYTVSGTSLTFTATPATGRKIVVYSVRAGVSGNNVEVQTINGNGSDHTFTLNVNPINENNTIVHIDGVYQQKSSYTVSGTSLSFGAGNIPANGTVIEVATFTQTEVNVPVNDTIDTVHIKDDAVTSAKLGGNLVTPGSLTVTGDFSPSADSTHDIGTSANRFANAYFDSFYGTVGTASQPNITSVGTLSGLTVTNPIAGSVTGTAATVTGAAQTNITSVGTLTGLTMSGALTLNTGSSGVPTINLSHSNSGADNFRIMSGITGVSNSGFSIYDVDASASRLVINSSGHVGIGLATAPSAPLDVITNSTVWAGEFTQSNTSNGDGVIVTVGSTASADYALSIRSDAGNTPGLNVKADGNVGIGTFTPDAKIHVKKTAASTQHYDQYATAIIEDTEARLQLVATDGGSNAAGLLLSNETKHWGLVHHGTGNSNIFSIGYHATSSSNTDISDNLSDILNITTASNVGIGKVPGSVRLDVETDQSGNLAGFFTNTHASGSYGVKIRAGSSSSNYGFVVTDKDDSNPTHFYVRGDGQVGINTNSPAGTLHTVARSGTTGLVVTGVASNNIATFARSTGQTLGIKELGSTSLELESSTSLGYDVGSGYNHEFYVAGAAKVKINSSGNVGIGGGHSETRRNLGLVGSTPGVVFYDSNVTNLTHEIIGGGNAGLEISADYQNVGNGYVRFDIGAAEKVRITEKSAIIQKGGTAQYVQGGEFCSFNSGTYVCSQSGNTDRGILQLHSSVSSGTGTVYVACENSGQNVVWGYIIDFFFSNNSFSHTIRETGSSQSTTTPSMYVDASRNIYMRINYAGGLGGNIKVTAAGHVVCTNY